MSDELLGGVLLALVILPMVGLGVAAVQPSRANVRMAAVALGLLPAFVVVALLAAWVVGM
jgi:hypothetical protein